MRTVVGYVRTGYPERGLVDRLRRRIQRYCADVNLPLGIIFSDNGVQSSDALRPAFTAMLLSLRRAEEGVVVIPSLSHFSENPVEQEELCIRISQCGGIIVVIDESEEVARGLC